jgi:acyl-coenzyme A thioesterase PaaI-like protein
MDATALARSLLAPVPAHTTLGIEVQQASDGVATVTLATPPSMTNVIGSLHSSGLIALVDATGLAAIIAACEAETDFERILPLGAAASMEFRAPARGLLTASCGLGDDARTVLRPVLAGREDRARLSTRADVVDERDTLVCRGTFEWSVRRLPDAG